MLKSPEDVVLMDARLICFLPPFPSKRSILDPATNELLRLALRRGISSSEELDLLLVTACKNSSYSRFGSAVRGLLLVPSKCSIFDPATNELLLIFLRGMISSSGEG